MVNDSGIIYEEDSKAKGSVEDQQVERVSEEGDAIKSDSSIQILDAENRKKAERRLVRKLDMRLMPTIVLIFIMNYIDVCYSFLREGGLIDEKR